jgi:transposase
MEAEEKAMTEAIQEKGAEAAIPRGVGPLTFEVLRREVGDWSRFTNRRQVSSYTGLCPREHSSGSKRRGGSVSKKGNPRVRAMLVEMVWRMMRWQPDYHGRKKWLPVLGDPGRSAAARKKAIVAIEPPPTPGLRREGSRGDGKGNSISRPDSFFRLRLETIL